MNTPHTERPDGHEVDLTETIKHEDVKTARQFLKRIDHNAAILLAAEILADHAIDEGSDFGVIVQVDPAKMPGLNKRVEFEIKTKMLIDGRG